MSRVEGYLVTPGPLDDLAAAGWQVASHAALDLLTERLEAAGHATTEADASTCRSRHVEAIRRVEDPSGLPVELFVGPARADDTFTSEVAKGGFVTGELGMGHIVLRATDFEQTKRFYTELLGLRISDVVSDEVAPGREISVLFLHANPRHHSVAFAGATPITQHIGQHPNDQMVSFYPLTPSGFRVDLGWGGRLVDAEAHEEGHYRGFSIWGHHPHPGERPAG